MVQKTFSFDHMTAMSDAGMIVAYVDGRGTGFKGRKYRAVVSKNLGEVEAKDQLAAAK